MKRTNKEIINTIEDFINGTGGPWDWDDFISIKLKDPEQEKVRLMSALLPETHPPRQKGQYCNEAGIEFLKNKSLSPSLRS